MYLLLVFLFLVNCFSWSLCSHGYSAHSTLADEDTSVPKKKVTSLNDNIAKQDYPTEPREIIGIKENSSVNKYRKSLPIPKRKKYPISSEEANKIHNDNITREITDSIKKRLTQCWNIPTSVAYKNLSIKIKSLLTDQGEIVTTDIVDIDSYQKNNLFRAIADSAVRAIYKCSPLDLPKEHYNLWKEVILNFTLDE